MGAEPEQQNSDADSGGLLQKLQAGVAWFTRQSENTRIALIVAASLIGPIAFIALYSFISDNLVTILIVFAAMGILSSLGGALCYLRWKRRNEAEDRSGLDEHRLACPSCAEWNEREAEFCRNCARPFKDQKMLADFLVYRDQRESREKEARRSEPPASARDPAPLKIPAGPSRSERMSALTQSFTWAALVTMLLYLFLCWPVGVIVNLMWLSEAERQYRATGVSPAGRGCLKLLGLVFILVPFVLIVILALVLYLQSKGVPVLTPQNQGQ